MSAKNLKIDQLELDLINPRITNQRRIENGRFIEFPGVKGRILEKVEFFTAADFHSLTLYFQDKTSLTLIIEPCFLMAASFADRSSGEQRILKRWLPIRSATEK